MINLDNQIIIEHFPENQVSKKIGSSFYRGKICNFNPYKEDYIHQEFCREFVLKGYYPEIPIVKKSSKITAFGSCFAQHISNYLLNYGFNTNKNSNPNIYVSCMGEGLVNVYTILQQFEWVLENKEFKENLWFDKQGNVIEYDDNIKNETRTVFLNTEIFIITLGLSEIWYNKNNEVFWSAIPINKYNENDYSFKVCSFEETKNSIKKICNIINTYIPNSKIIFTLSPIPLAATFRNQSCITANSASKSILRAALDEFLRENANHNKSIFYFPSYEIINELFYDKYENDRRHVKKEIIDIVMKIFECYYCETNTNKIDIEKQLKYIIDNSKKFRESV